MKKLSELDLEDEEDAVETAEAKKWHSKISAAECEATAHPQKAREYKRPWDAFQAGCQLFKDKLNDVDRSSWDQADKSTFGKRTKTTHEWFNGLSKEKKREAELAADKWNREGAPKQQHVVYIFPLQAFLNVSWQNIVKT